MCSSVRVIVRVRVRVRVMVRVRVSDFPYVGRTMPAQYMQYRITILSHQIKINNRYRYT